MTNHLCRHKISFLMYPFQLVSPHIAIQGLQAVKVINKVNSKVNDLLSSVGTGDASFWTSSITNTFLEYPHEPFEWEHVV